MPLCIQIRSIETTASNGVTFYQQDENSYHHADFCLSNRFWHTWNSLDDFQCTSIKRQFLI